MIVATGAGAVRTAVTDTWETAEDLVDWLRIVFRRDGWLPESLYLVGALADLDEVTQPIADALPIPVSDSGDTQLALARGAALATVGRLDGGDTPSTEPRERPWRMSRPKKTITPVAETIAMATVGPVDTDSIHRLLRHYAVSEPRSDRPWLVSHARKLTISAAAVAVFGAALSLTAGSALNVENTSTQAGEPAAERAPLTSASPYPVLAPISAAPAAAGPSAGRATGTAGNHRRSSALCFCFAARDRFRRRAGYPATRVSARGPARSAICCPPWDAARPATGGSACGAGRSATCGPAWIIPRARTAWATARATTAWATAWAPIAWCRRLGPNRLGYRLGHNLGSACGPCRACPGGHRSDCSAARRTARGAACADRCATSSGVGALGRCRRATSTGSGAVRLGPLFGQLP